jgi:carbon monoxide dehydrogenase subunit G
MVKSAASVMVARTPDDVFRYVADIRNEPTWHTDVVSVPPETDPVPVVGKTYPVTMKPFMGKTDGALTALEVQPSARLVFRAGLGGAQAVLSYLVEPASEGTRSTRAVDVKLKGAMRLMTPMMALMLPPREQGLRPESQARPRVLNRACATLARCG